MYNHIYAKKHIIVIGINKIYQHTQACVIGNFFGHKTIKNAYEAIILCLHLVHLGIDFIESISSTLFNGNNTNAIQYTIHCFFV